MAGQQPRRPGPVLPQGPPPQRGQIQDENYVPPPPSGGFGQQSPQELEELFRLMYEQEKLAEAAQENQGFRLGPIDEGINAGKAKIDAWLSNLVRRFAPQDKLMGSVEMPQPSEGPAMRSLPQAAGPVGRRLR